MDQAGKLREIMANIKTDNQLSMVKDARVISISSGKGGVGKTNLAVNLSIALKEEGYDVLILDADIGLGNVEILTGSSLKNSISDMIFADKTIEEVISTGPCDIKILSGGSGLKELALLDNENFPIIIDALESLQSSFDFIIIDTGAGISSGVLDFIMASDEVIVVSTPDPTSVMDAYVLIKSLNIRSYKGKINLITNMVSNRNEAEATYMKINNVTREFLKMEINYLGYINRDRVVDASIRNQIPFILGYPNKMASKQVRDIRKNLLDRQELEFFEENKESFAERLVNFFFRA